MSDEQPQLERRAMIGLTPEEKDNLIRHMALEEAREQAQIAKFEVGEERMDRIEEDLQPIKKMYWAVIGSASVGLFLLGSLVYIYKTDREEMRAMQGTIQMHSIAIEKMIASHQELERDYRRDTSRLEQILDKLTDKVMKK